LIGTLGNDRLLLNDGTGKFTLSPGATPNDTSGTLGLAVADLDGDGRLDIVQGQGEVAFPEKVQLASASNPIDTVAPAIRVQGSGSTIRAQIHDFIGPSHIHDFQRVVVKLEGDEVEMTWYGGMLWRARLPVVPASFQVCATDRNGNTACTSTGGGDGLFGDDAGTDHPPSGGCCDSGGARGSWLLAAVVAVIANRRRSTRRAACARRA
jgi:hypothetical protein